MSLARSVERRQVLRSKDILRILDDIWVSCPPQSRHNRRRRIGPRTDP
jgi:hypothetical protein